MSDRTTFVAIDGVDPDELSSVEQHELAEAVREYCEGMFDPASVDVTISDEPFSQ